MDLKHTDITGHTGSFFECMIGRTFRHNARAKYYKVKAIVYLGEMDMWGLLYQEEGSDVQHVRSHINFFGTQAGSTELRFEQV
jgi:hypothetical protein